MGKEVRCWIRGHMDEADYKDDEVRLETIRCPYRKGEWGYSLIGYGRTDYFCTHPAVTSEHVLSRELPKGGVIIGGVDGYATFCKPVDIHLTSLGEPSRYIIEGEWTVIKEDKLLPPPKEENE